MPVGVLSARRPYSLFDQVATTLAFIGFSLPTFFTGLLFILLFSIYLDWLPFIYRADIQATGLRWLWENLKQGIMPITVLGLFQGAQLTRFVRSSVLDVIQLDYIRTARSKGLAERNTLVKHVVRNALIPVVTLLAIQVPQIFTGARGDGADLPGARHRLPPDQLDPVERHASDHGRDVRVRGAGAWSSGCWPTSCTGGSTRGSRSAEGGHGGERHGLGGAGGAAGAGARPAVRLALGRGRAGGSGGTGSPWSGWSCSPPWSWRSWSDRSSTGCPIDEIDFRAKLKGALVGPSVRHRRPRAGHPGPDPLRRPDLPGGGRRRHADRDLRRAPRWGRWPASSAARSTAC